MIQDKSGEQEITRCQFGSEGNFKLWSRAVVFSAEGKMLPLAAGGAAPLELTPHCWGNEPCGCVFSHNWLDSRSNVLLELRGVFNAVKWSQNLQLGSKPERRRRLCLCYQNIRPPSLDTGKNFYGAPREIGNNLSSSASGRSLKTDDLHHVSEVLQTGGDNGFVFLSQQSSLPCCSCAELSSGWARKGRRIRARRRKKNTTGRRFKFPFCFKFKSRIVEVNRKLSKTEILRQACVSLIVILFLILEFQLYWRWL